MSEYKSQVGFSVSVGFDGDFMESEVEIEDGDIAYVSDILQCGVKGGTVG
ncbi:MAG: hypothetical protein ACTSYB_01845 [Candidatus Helarchaeota archaeon]